jgi:16S rRNA A1518/A1519 N6-dimethyltransferase RsmA/KsgA/DIM1 with predicted DNA glycosylase/AP lyase activity
LRSKRLQNCTNVNESITKGVFFADEYWPLKLSKLDIVLDVGANIGAFTLNVAPKVKHVIAIRT